jgi:hypothetical protein
MIVYNVTIKVEHDAATAWVSWMKHEHIADLINTGLFIECRLCKLLEQDEADGVTYSAQYLANSIDDYNTYIADHAETMRNKAFKMFGGKFIAFRSVMEII